VLEVSLFGASPLAEVCVHPTELVYGTTAAERSFVVSACGSGPIGVTDVFFSSPAPGFVLVAPPPLPLTLVPGSSVAISVRFVPAAPAGATAVIDVRSDDPVSPDVDVHLTGGPVLEPPSAGRTLYFWRVSGPTGDVWKLPLQGLPAPTPFWGASTGKSCSGCHSISPDGRFMAVVSGVGYGLSIVDIDTSLEIPLPFTTDGTIIVSWRPDVNTNPPYQFAFDEGSAIQIGSVLGGLLGPLAGADRPDYVQGMPTWGPNGKIAFVRGLTAGFLAFEGSSDLMLIDEAGGAAHPLNGASGGGLNYYPAFSPDGRWIAFTFSHADSTYGAHDAKIRLVAANQSGLVLPLDVLNGSTGASSFPSWSADGRVLSFSSNRPGGSGSYDVYVSSIDPITGADGPPANLSAANSTSFEHLARFSP
jgi:hypothetical protein